MQTVQRLKLIQPGERVIYYRGFLGMERRALESNPAVRFARELAGEGKAILTQRRVAENDYEYIAVGVERPTKPINLEELSPSKRHDREERLDEVYQILMTAADRNEAAPTNTQIANMLGVMNLSYVNELIKELEKRRLIRVTRYISSRQVFIFETSRSTFCKKPPKAIHAEAELCQA